MHLRNCLYCCFSFPSVFALGGSDRSPSVMAAAVRMVLYEDDSVQVQYIDGSKLQLSPCGSEFLFEKSPPISAHPLKQPERIRQRTHFVISTYRVSNVTKTTFANIKILFKGARI